MSGDWSYRLREHKGTLLALAAFVVMFTIYATNHPAGLNANVATTAANKGVLLAIVAMAQTLVVLTSGIDLSVGMVMVLANCLASSIVVGSPLTTTLGVLGVLLVGCLCGAINGLIVIFGRLQPIVATIIGEGSFHQVHGGTTTNQSDPVERRSRVHSYAEHYAELRGRPGAACPGPPFAGDPAAAG